MNDLKMWCFFCQVNNGHSSEECSKTPDYRSRMNFLKDLEWLPCFCIGTTEMQSICNCKKVCHHCFQHHHEAFCPKQDLHHPSLNASKSPRIERFDLFQLPTVPIQRIFELCDITSKMKLRQTCKYFKNQKSFNPKLVPFYASDFGLNHHQNPRETYILNRYIFIEHQKTFEDIMEMKNIYLFPERVYLKDSELNQRNLKILNAGDPNFLNLESCKLDSDISFKNLLENFPYADKLFFKQMKLPNTWIVDLFEAKRNCDIINFEGDITEEEIKNISLDELSQLFLLYKKLKIVFTVTHIPQIIENINNVIESIQTHFNRADFLITNDIDTFQIMFYVNLVEISFHYSPIMKKSYH